MEMEERGDEFDGVARPRRSLVVGYLAERRDAMVEPPMSDCATGW